MEIEKVCVSDMSYADDYGDDCQDYEGKILKYYRVRVDGTLLTISPR